MHGDLGLIATEEFERQRVARAEELAKLTAKREALERQVQIMSDGSLEKDMLDEIAPLPAECLAKRRDRHIQQLFLS